MGKTFYKIKKISNLGIFRSLVILSHDLFPKLINLNRDIKRTFGDEIMKLIYNGIKDLKHAYQTENEEEKVVYLKQLKDDIELVELSLKFINEIGYIDDKNFYNISHNIADILIQINSWLKQYNK